MAEITLPVSDLEQNGEERLRAEIENNLTSGIWAAGMRLPTERELCKTFGIARARVRRVLQRFERDGQITRTVGSGTFVTRPSDPSTVSDEEIESTSPEDLIDVRLIMEPNMANLIVRRATETDLAKLRDLLSAAKQAPSMAEFEEYDHQFHLELVNVTKNKYLIRMMTRIMAVRQSRSWVAIRRHGLTTDRQSLYQKQHEAILASIEMRNSKAFRKAMQKHLKDVRRNLGL